MRGAVGAFMIALFVLTFDRKMMSWEGSGL